MKVLKLYGHTGQAWIPTNLGDNLLGVFISEDANKTKRFVEEFISLFQEAVNKAVKDALKGEPPKAGGASKFTKEQILEVKDRTERQKLIQENMSLLAQLETVQERRRTNYVQGG